MFSNLKVIVEKLNGVHLGIFAFEKQSRHLSEFSVFMLYQGSGISSLSWALLFAFQLLRMWLWKGFFPVRCCPSKPNMVSVPSHFHSYVMSHLYVLPSAFLFFFSICVHSNSTPATP